jgi:hypothetical protein
MSPGVAKSPGGGLTAVAMSGGLDSSVAAHLLASRGEPVVGLSMLLWEGVGEPAVPSGSGRCCGALDLGDARRVAEQIGIPHYTLREPSTGAAPSAGPGWRIFRKNPPIIHLRRRRATGGSRAAALGKRKPPTRCWHVRFSC